MVSWRRRWLVKHQLTIFALKVEFSRRCPASLPTGPVMRLSVKYPAGMKGLSRKEAAALAGVSESTIIGWQVTGLLRPALPGKKHRLTAEDVLVARQLAHGGD